MRTWARRRGGTARVILVVYSAGQSTPYHRMPSSSLGVRSRSMTRPTVPARRCGECGMRPGRQKTSPCESMQRNWDSHARLAAHLAHLANRNVYQFTVLLNNEGHVTDKLIEDFL